MCRCPTTYKTIYPTQATLRSILQCNVFSLFLLSPMQLILERYSVRHSSWKLRSKRARQNAYCKPYDVLQNRKSLISSVRNVLSSPGCWWIPGVCFSESERCTQTTQIYLAARNAGRFQWVYPLIETSGKLHERTNEIKFSPPTPRAPTSTCNCWRIRWTFLIYW